jgi:uncharacterized protein Usg
MGFSINKQDLIKSIKESLNLRTNEPDSFIEYCLKMTTIEVQKKFSRLFYLELVKDSNEDGIIELPNDLFKIISVQNQNIEARAVDVRTAAIYSNRDLSYVGSFFYTLKQDPSLGKNLLQLVPKGSYTNINIICQTINDGVGNIPVQYEEVLFLGARYKYVASKRPPNEIQFLQFWKEDYKNKLDELAFDQNQLVPDNRWKQYYEADWERNTIYNPSDETLDRF